MGGFPGLQKHYYPWWGVDPATQEDSVRLPVVWKYDLLLGFDVDR